MKGQFMSYTLFVVLALVLLGGAGVGMFLYSAGLSETLQFQMNDLNTISEASTYGDYYRYNFMPKAVNLSEQKAAYPAAQKSGEIEWNSNVIPYSNIKEVLGEKIEPEMRDMFESYMKDSDAAIRCSVESDYQLEVNPEKNLLQGDVSNMSCSPTKNIKAVYGMPQRVEIAHSSRYLGVGADMHELVNKTKNRLPDRSVGEDVERITECQSSISSSEKQREDEQAKQNARSEAISPYQSVPSDAETATDFLEGVKLENKGIEFLPKEATIVESRTPSCVLYCGLSGCTYGEEYYTKARYVLTEAVVDYTLNDTKVRVLTENGAKYLVFPVKYNHYTEDYAG